MNESANGGLSALDRPNSYIGKTVPRPNAKRLIAGRGTFVDDIKLGRMVHLAFLRCPYAHAAIGAIDTSAGITKESTRIRLAASGAS